MSLEGSPCIKTTQPYVQACFNLLMALMAFVVGLLANCDRLVRQIEEAKPDVVLMDIELPGISGIEAAKKLKRKFPEVKVLMETILRG